MFWNRITIVVVALILGACASEKRGPYAEHPVLLNAYVWLEESTSHAPFVYIDLRSPALYNEGHLPGAINLTRSDIRKKDSEYGGMAMNADILAILLGSKGITPDDWLILYDEKGGVEAARLWWILRVYGHERVKILNGDLHAFDNKLETGYTPRPETEFQFTGKPETGWAVDFSEFEKLRSNPSTKVLDCRSAAEYDGDYIKPGAFKAGHIDGAVNICYSHTIENSSEDNLKIKSPEALRRIYQDFAQPDDTILVYCQSGVRSAHMLMVLREILDYKNVYNYDGSWIEWSYKNQPTQRDSLATNDERI